MFQFPKQAIAAAAFRDFSNFALAPPELRHGWLDDLGRNARPSGLGMLSFPGEHAVARSRIDATHLRELEEKGELFVQTDEPVNRILGDRGLYGMTCMLREGALTIGAGDLEVVAIVPAGIGNHQDLLVFQKHR